MRDIIIVNAKKCFALPAMKLYVLIGRRISMIREIANFIDLVIA